MTKVSVCIVTYNNRSSVIKTIRTLLENTKTVDLKIYISDNASNDDTVGEVRREFEDNNIVEIIRNGANIGFGLGHNKVLDRLESDYHLILNPDIVFIEDSISRLVEYMTQNPEVGMITPKILNPDGSEQFLPKRKPTVKYLVGGRLERLGGLFKKWRVEYTRKTEVFTSPVDIEFCTGCFMMIRTSIFKALSGFDERFFMYFEDADLSRMVLRENTVIFYPETSVVHEWARMNGRTFKYFLIQVESMCKYFNKWRYQDKNNIL